MQIIDEKLLDETAEKAKQSPRLRINHNFHERLTDPLNRMINAIEPESYLRPHRHLDPDKDESFLVLRGKAAFFIFDDQGAIVEKAVLDPRAGVYGADIKAGVWHGLLVLEPDTVLYEAKAGPFTPLSPGNFAPWSPAPENVEEVKAFMSKLKSEIRK